jgi:preprotein translocase subunit SecE
VTTETRSGSAVGEYLNDTRAELRKVVWPTREQAQTLTIIVLIVVVAMTMLLGGMDFILSIVLKLILPIASA